MIDVGPRLAPRQDYLRRAVRNGSSVIAHQAPGLVFYLTSWGLARIHFAPASRAALASA
jgi:hypothetical protein